MEYVAHFEKISFEQYKRACEDTAHAGLRLNEEALRDEWENIKFPSRATSGSAGYDFCVPFDMLLEQGKSRIIPTGIRCSIKPGWALFLLPKSGLGFKYETHLANTIGVVDSDYYGADNEGHILIKMKAGKQFCLQRGQKFAQGIFLPFGIVKDDEANGVRTGGFGSTGA